MKNFLALAKGLLGEGKLQIPHADAAQLRMEEGNRPCNQNAEGTGERARQNANETNQDPGEGVFESIAQGAEREPCHGFSRICADKANGGTAVGSWLLVNNAADHADFAD